MNNKTTTKQREFLPNLIVRPELNLEKWSTIWQPAHLLLPLQVRVSERQKNLKDGSIFLSRVEVSPSLRHGNLTTEDQKTFYALIRLWELKGKPEVLVFSLRELANVLGKTWGTRNIELLKSSLLRLNATSLTWLNSYYDSTTKELYKNLSAFHILVNLDIAEKISHSGFNKQACSVRFHQLIERNLRNKYTRPVMFNIIVNLRSGIAQILYKYLEFVMHTREEYEEASKKLFEKLGFIGQDYGYASIRKRLLDKAIKELNSVLQDVSGLGQGFPIPSGIVYITLEKTKDVLDWKIVCKKIPQPMLPFENSLENEEEQEDTPAVVVEVKEIAKEIKQLKKESKTTATDKKSELNLAEQIVRFFLEKFRVKRTDPLSKELLTVKQWISKYNLDLEKAQVFISRCKDWTAETGFDVQNIAGLRQYLDRTAQIFEQMEINRAIKACKLCDDNGYIDGQEENGREFVFRCDHDLSELQQYSSKGKIRITLYDKSIIEPK